MVTTTTTYTTARGITYRDKIDAYFMALMVDGQEANTILGEITEEWLGQGMTDLRMVGHKIQVEFAQRGYGSL